MYSLPKVEWILKPTHTWIQDSTRWQHNYTHNQHLPAITTPNIITYYHHSIMDVGNLHFTGDVIHIVGTNIDCHGSSCPQHALHPCGLSLRVDDWVVFCLVHLDDEGLDEDADD